MEATIGHKYEKCNLVLRVIYVMCRFLQPEAVFHNFEQKMVSICQKDFTNFNEFLALMAAKDVQTEPSDKGNTFFVMGNPNSTLTYSD